MIFKHILDQMIQFWLLIFNLDNKEEKPFISSFTYIGDEQKINTPDDSTIQLLKFKRQFSKLFIQQMILKDCKMKDKQNFKLFKEDKLNNF